MLKRSGSLLLCLWLGMMLAREGMAQPNRFLPTGDVAYQYLNRLQRRGLLPSLHPTALPYRQGDVAAALDELDRNTLAPVEAHWVAMLEALLGRAAPGDDEAVAGLDLDAGLDAANTRRLDPLRPLGDAVHAYEHIALRFFLDDGPFVGQLGLRHDLYYDRDPDGLDAVKRLLTRSEESYAGWHTGPASIYLGRLAHHWGLPGETAVVLSDNPRSYDLIAFRLGGQRLSLRSLLGELDSITADGRYTGIAGDDSVRAGSERRYLAAHRFDWRPSENVLLSLMESALYSGAGSGLSLKYLNPLHPFLFVVDNRPKNDENNGLFAGLLWLRLGRVTVHGQLLMDDFDVLNATEPASFALAGSLVYTARTFDLGGTLDVIAARTYNTIQPEGRYLYLLRGLATQFSDYVHAALFADLYPAPALTVSPRLHYLAQGERDIRQPFPRNEEQVPTLLDGTVEHTARAAVEVFYQHDPRWWLRVDLGVNVTKNRGAVRGHDETRFAGAVAFGLRLGLRRTFRLHSF
ncbi:MAG: hypothetical protein KatS3mg044_1141 [Rhodothermaceae bacterium]|nr:MAG: hypothetical protein KatS3mg044_1141 [Rhodothermaceae bacterium]